MVLEDSTIREYIACLRGAREDIRTQLPGLMKATGEVRAAYHRVLLDKAWKVSRLSGEFYYEVISGVAQLQSELEALLSLAPSGPQFEDDYAKWKAKMVEVEARLGEMGLPMPSDIPSAEPQSAPSPSHQPPSQ
jgi:hypothetical protein